MGEKQGASMEKKGEASTSEDMQGEDIKVRNIAQGSFYYYVLCLSSAIYCNAYSRENNLVLLQCLCALCMQSLTLPCRPLP